MAYGFSPVLPLQKSEEDGFYALTKSLKENIKQNFKNLVLTSPGERIMLPAFGVGIRDFLFSLNADTYDDLHTEINLRMDAQVKKYLPFITVDSIDIIEDKEISNSLLIKIFYRIPRLQVQDVLSVSTTKTT